MGQRAAANLLPDDASPTRVRYKVLGAGCSVAVLIYIHRVGFARALPSLEVDLHLQPWQTSCLTAAFMVAYGLFEVPCGVLGDRLGVRHVLTVLVLGWSLMTGCAALVGIVPDVGMLPFYFLLLIRFLFGTFQAGGFPSLSRMMTDWMPASERASAQGFIWMSTRLGGMIIPLVLGWMMVRIGNWQTPLWIVSSLGMFWCAAFWPWFRNRPEDMPGVNAAERAVIAAGRASGPRGHGKVPWRLLLRCPSVWALCLMYGCGGFAANFYVTLLPSYLRNQRHLSEKDTDWLSSLPFAFGLVACVGGGLFSDWIIKRTGNRKWGRRLNGTVGTTLGGFAWLSLNQAESTWVVGLVLCLIFFCNDLPMGPAWASCADIGERYAGTIGGAMNMIGSLMGAVGNLVAGALFGRIVELPFLRTNAGEPYEMAGNDLLFTIYAGAFWLAAVCWQFVDVTKPIREETG